MRAKGLGPTAAAVLLAAVLGGCGLYLGYEDDFDDDDRPNVELAVSVTHAAPGELIRLVAAASDDFEVESVSFFRLQGNSQELLERDRSSPYELDTLIPADAVGTVRYFARATDDIGQTRDSAAVVVTID